MLNDNDGDGDDDDDDGDALSEVNPGEPWVDNLINACCSIFLNRQSDYCSMLDVINGIFNYDIIMIITINIIVIVIITIIIIIIRKDMHC